MLLSFSHLRQFEDFFFFELAVDPSEPSMLSVSTAVMESWAPPCVLMFHDQTSFCNGNNQ